MKTILVFSKVSSNVSSNVYSKVFIICTFILILIIIILYTYTYDSFLTQDNSKQQNFERTQLYGSLFLEKLDEVIKNMTDPPINYDTKRIELNKYSDVLL